jgi:hypothetical protein
MFKAFMRDASIVWLPIRIQPLKGNFQYNLEFQLAVI